MRHFVLFTGQEEPFGKYRISRGDLILLGLAAAQWRTGDVVSLSAQQRVTLADLHKRCLDLGDEGVKKDIQNQNIGGVIGWLIVLGGIALICSYGCPKH